ncbi:MAG: bifunctional 4-hydroxy-2-oxoglutarate aldolase/2-dehydro-3-deoxy-phosphogluconate aldolase, partial [Cyanobium sp.]
MPDFSSAFLKVASAEGPLPWRGGRWLRSREWGLLTERDDAPSPSGKLIRSLRHQPLLIVLRPSEPLAAIPVLQRLQALGVIHVEIAWQAQSCWLDQMAELRRRFPRIALGAASVCDPQGVMEAASAGCRYVVSPVLDPELLEVAARWEIVL